MRSAANFAPTSLGARIQQGIVDLVASGEVRPVVGKVVAFDEIPAALAAMIGRDTVGRVIARLW